MEDADASRATKISNKLGLHIRPSFAIAQLAREYQSDIEIRVRDRTALADSQLDLLMLLGYAGAEAVVSAKGPDAKEAVDAIVKLIEGRFGEPD